jgi:hypothetical protein
MNLIGELTIKYNHSKWLISIFFLALLFRIVLINLVNTDTIAYDGTGYHQIAYNLSKGKGYSLKEGEKYFFREPVYPLFLSLSFTISNLFGNKSEVLSIDENHKIINKAPEIAIAKYMQAIIDSLACVLLFIISLSILKLKYALIISFIFCFYPAYAVNVTIILRETIQSFLTLGLCYTLLQFFKHEKRKYLIFTGILWGLLNLTFQANLVFAFSIPIFICIFKRSLKKAIIPSIIVGMTMIFVVSPWLIRTYACYPDIRILKSFGTSLTPEHRSYFESVIKAEYYGLITMKQKDSIQSTDWLGIAEKDKFRLSWDGTITKKRDSINILINEPLISKRKIIRLGLYLRNCMPQTFAGPIIQEKPIIALLIIIPVLFICILALIGMFKFFPKFFKINIVLVTYLSIFIFIASEKRRMLPIQPFVFMYGMIGVIYLYNKYIKKLDDNSISKLLF